MRVRPLLPITPRRSAIALLYAIFLLLLLEGAARTFLWARHGVSPLRPAETWLAYYPELARVPVDTIGPDDGFLDVLLLGGSVVDQRWSPIGPLLARGIARSTRARVRLHNLAFPAHTTRDSLLKIERLADVRFDLVVVYHGINEARANNVPPELFRKDYSHYSWYRIVNALRAHPELDRLALPFVAHFAAIALDERLRPDDRVPTDAPRPEWVHFGDDVRSAGSFRQNLQDLVAIAERQGAPVVLMTFALYLPEGEAGKAFLEKPFVPGTHSRPLSLWGTRANVEKAVEAHNTAVRKLAAARPSLVLVDQQASMPRGEEFFFDACHLTEAGSEAFVEGVLEAFLNRLSVRVRE